MGYLYNDNLIMEHDVIIAPRCVLFVLLTYWKCSLQFVFNMYLERKANVVECSLWKGVFFSQMMQALGFPVHNPSSAV